MKEIKTVSKESLNKFFFWTCIWKEEHKTVKEEQPNWSFCPLCWDRLPSTIMMYNKNTK